MRKAVSLMIIFGNLSLAAIAQEKGKIVGFTKDALSKAALPAASLSATRLDNTQAVHMQTSDPKGAFSIRGLANGYYRVQVAYVGYKTLLRDSLLISAENKTLDLGTLSLQLQNENLKTVTVTTVKPFIVQSADRITLNVAGSPVAAGNNAYDVLLTAPGVLAEQNGNLQIRGKGVAVYIDGRPSNLTNEELKNFLTSLGSASIEKIDLIVNPSARYDAQGGAVIDIRTVKNKAFGSNGVASLGIGSGKHARYNAGISFNTRRKKVNIYGSYDHQHNSQYFDNRSVRTVSPELTITEREYDSRYRDNHAYKLGIDYDLNRRTSTGLLLRGYTNFRDRIVNNQSTLNYRAAPDSISNVATDGFARFHSPSVNAYLRTTLDSAGKKELSFNVDVFAYHKAWRNDFVTTFLDGGGKEYRAPALLRDNSPADNRVKAFSADYSQPLKKGKLEAGLKSTFTTTDNDVVWENRENGGWMKDITKTNRFVYKENIAAAYVSGSYAVKKGNLTAGLRLEHTSTEGQSRTLDATNKMSYTNLFPNISFLYNLSKNQQYNFAFRKNIVRYGFDFVNPFIVYQSQYSYSQGNPYLRPQINHSIEVSHVYKYRLFTSLSYTHADNALSPVYRQDPSKNLLISSYDNLASSDMLVLTFSLNRTFFKKWTSVNTLGGYYVKYNFQQAAGADANATLTGYASTNNTVVLPKKFLLEVTGLYRSPFASGIFNMNSFFTVSSGIGKPIAKGKGHMKLNLSDLFNTQRFENRVTNYQQVNGVFINKPESRFINLALTWKLGSAQVKASKTRKSSIDEERARMGAN